jgi:AcrR family transcriptional regulator
VSNRVAKGAETEISRSPSPTLSSIGEARREMYRQQVIAAAEVEFAKTGFDGTKVTDIARTAGVSQATLYKHFEGKEEIWDALNQHRLHEFTSLGLAAAGGSASRLDGLFSMLTAQVSYFVAHPGFLQVHAREGLSWGTAAVDMGRGGQREVWRAGVDAMTEVADQLIASGEVPPMRPRILAGLVISALQVYLVDWLNQGRVASAEEVSSELIAHLRRALTAQ